MSSYIGRHAELYDLFYSEKEYEKEASFVHQCLQLYSTKPVKTILELACGTGSHAFEFEKFGYNIIATDYSEDMLRMAQEKAIKNSSSIEFMWQDMKSLDVFERPFDAVICLFDSIGYVVTNEALKQVFSGVHRHLLRGGLFIFEFWHAVPMIKKYDPIRIRKWNTQKAEIIRLSETTLDYVNQTGKVKYTIIEKNNYNTCNIIEELQENRFFLVQEMKMLLSENKFEPLTFFAGFNPDKTITDETWHIIAVARCK